MEFKFHLTIETSNQMGTINSEVLSVKINPEIDYEIFKKEESTNK